MYTLIKRSGPPIDNTYNGPPVWTIVIIIVFSILSILPFLGMCYCRYYHLRHKKRTAQENDISAQTLPAYNPGTINEHSENPNSSNPADNRNSGLPAYQGNGLEQDKPGV